MGSKVTSTDEIAELLVYLGRAARGVDTGSNLTAAQWTALRFFARANDISRTPSAFASFHATTRGTASQTIKSLLTKGYLARSGAADDKRSVRYDLTDAGTQVMCGDPLRELSDAIDRLDAGLKSALRQALPALVGQLADIRDTVAFGTCGDCRHFSGGVATSYCACVAAELAPADLGRLCINFAASQDRTLALHGVDKRKTK
jgi:DNA-binding MarR family transcriptional regulator